MLKSMEEDKGKEEGREWRKGGRERKEKQREGERRC